MPTSASTKATTAKARGGTRCYPLQTWREASEGFPMIDVYRWWSPKIDSLFGNFDLLAIWHALERPSTDILDLWSTESLHAQAVDLLDTWHESEERGLGFPGTWQASCAQAMVDLLDAWAPVPSNGKETWRMRINQLLDWRKQANDSRAGTIEEWNSARDFAREMGKWQWTNELPQRR